jgi:hypothetical protein
MSIVARMAPYELHRAAATLDDYGIMNATPILITTIDVSITKNNTAHDENNPKFVVTDYIGITTYDSVAEGDILISGFKKYIVRDIGNRGAKYQPLYIDKL